MNPGLEPAEWIEVPPAWQVASTRARTAGSMLSGWWNSPRGGDHVAPDASSAHLVLARLGGRGDVHPGEGQLRMVDDAAQRSGADVPWAAADAVGRRLFGLVAEGEDRCLDPVLEAEFGEDAADVSLDRLLADCQIPGDLPVAVPAGYQPQHVALAG
jgi:hypothetical protein